MASKCDHCEKAFNKNENKTKCSFCDAKFHAECVTLVAPLITRSVLETIKKTGGCLTFRCNKCVADQSAVQDGLSSKLDNLEKYMQQISAHLFDIKKELASDRKHHNNCEKIFASKIKKLEDGNNLLRKQLNRGDIIISGLPSNINNINLHFIVIELAKYLGVDIELFHLNFCSWIRKKSAVLVKFNNVLIRDVIMKNYRMNYDLSLKKILPAEDIDSRIYLNNHYTPEVSKFRFYCRKLVTTKKILKYEMISWDIPRARLHFYDGKQEEADIDYVVKLNLPMSSSMNVEDKTNNNNLQNPEPAAYIC